MSETELTAAKLDEIRQRANDEIGCVRLTWHECIMLIAAARRSLVDDEPITEEWLRGLGFELAPGVWHQKRINEALSVYHYIEGETSTIDDDEMGTEVVVHNITTRGQLTKLIEALGGTT